MATRFTDYLAAHVDEINQIMATYFQGRTDNPELERYLYGPLTRYSANAGKRIRPIICTLACEAVGGDPSRARVAGCAIEHFQSAALIHDDIADNGELRRGEPCLHITEGIGLATNCGDLELSEVTRIILDDDSLSNDLKIRVLDELTRMTARTIEGQALDLGWVSDQRFDLTVEDYLTMATLKTAHYSGAVPLALGAIIGGGGPATVEALRSFGLDTGLAFQIQDDLLNLIGDAGDKDFRSDITEGKRTLIAVHALENPDAHDEVERILRAGTADPALTSRAVDIFRATGSIDYAHRYALDLTDRAKHTLEEAHIDAESREVLLSMADFFVERLK